MLVMQLLSVSIFADDTEVSTEPTQGDVMGDAATFPEDSDIDGKQPSTRVIGEMPELRSQSEKHYRLSDGSYTEKSGLKIPIFEIR